jgi:RNA polymerase sigma-70 factor (ECF subfamily)
MSDVDPPDPRPDPDQRLMERFQKGDIPAFEVLLHKYQGPVLSLVRRYLGSRSPGVDDVAQEVFVRAWRSLSGFRGDSAFRTWLHTVAINVVRTSQSRSARLLRVFLPAGGRDPRGELPDRASDAEPVDSVLARRQLVERALAALPDDLRIAVTLRDLQGLDYKEIAAVLRVPIGTVESRIFRARQRLKPLLAPLIVERGEKNEP